MARKRASMREGPLAELFRATEAAQRAEGKDAGDAPPSDASAVAPEQQTIEIPAAATPESTGSPSIGEVAALEETVEHVYDFEVADAPVMASAPPPAVEPILTAVESPAGGRARGRAGRPARAASGRGG